MKRLFVASCLLLAGVLCASAHWQSRDSNYNKSIVAAGGCTINSVSLSNNSFVGGSSSGTVVGTISSSLTGSCGSDAFTLTGTDAASFQIVGTSLETSGTVAAGSYSINIVDTIAGASGSPYTQPETITGTPATIIVSIEQGTCSMAAAADSCTYTVLGASGSGVTVANTMVLYNGATTNAGESDYGRFGVGLTLTNTTTVTASRGSTSTDAVTAYFTVIQFTSAVINSGGCGIRYGTITIALATTSNTSSSFGTCGANAFVLHLGTTTTNGTQGLTSILTGVSLNTSTGVVTATTATAPLTDPLIVSFVVVDLTSSAVSAATQCTYTSTATSGTDVDSTCLSGGVILANTTLMDGGIISAGTSDLQADYYATLTNTTTVTFARVSTSNAASRTHYYTAVAWAAAALNGSIQRPGPVNLASQSSNTKSVSTLAGYSASAGSNKAWINWNGFSANASSLFGEYTRPYLTLTNATTVTAGTNAADTNALNIGFEAGNFN